MKRLIGYAEEYLKIANWKDIALLKICLYAAGIMMGMALPKKFHKPAAFITTIVFTATYIPLVLKFLNVVGSHDLKN